MDGSIECPYCGYKNKITYDDHEGRQLLIKTYKKL